MLGIIILVTGKSIWSKELEKNTSKLYISFSRTAFIINSYHLQKTYLGLRLDEMLYMVDRTISLQLLDGKKMVLQQWYLENLLLELRWLSYSQLYI